MKKISFLAVATLLFAASCNVTVKSNEDKTETTSAEQVTANKTKAEKDPVCDMEKGNDWTEYTVTGSDTTWFCSPHCKETFAKNPEKYIKKETETKG